MMAIKRCEHCGFPLYNIGHVPGGPLVCETRGCPNDRKSPAEGELPEALVREIRESEGRCASCGAFDGPTHQCPQYTATRHETPYALMGHLEIDPSDRPEVPDAEG